MSNKIISTVEVVVVLVAAGCLVAQKTESEPGKARKQETRILNVLEEMLNDQYSAMLSVPPEDGKVLRLLAEATGAKHIVEVGTSNGYASIWFCLALRSTSGRLTTFEIDARRAALARENFKRAGVDKLVTLIVGDAHEKVTIIKEPIDIVFIDADKDGYLDYLNKLLPLVRPGGLIVAHDTTDAGSLMEDYLKAVTTKSELETIFLHEYTTGIGVTLKKRQYDNRSNLNLR
ncbi:MAG: O-methyltransferase [Sedimentisphaerales bacterium]|nr:O-methyltransferase [Sedimentisphaerales bacterium]